MINRYLPVILLLMALSPSARADDVNNVGGQKKFELQINMSERMQLSRDEVDPRATGMGSLGAQKGQVQNGAQKPARPEAPPVVASMPPQAPDIANHQVGGQSQQPIASSDANGYLNEYNVAWSAWVGHLADRWYFALRTAEEGLGIQFATARPALIQFTCYPDGSIGNVVIRQSSGIPAYDQLQVAALLATTPTAPFPSGTKRVSITLVQGWESHSRQPGELDFQPGSFGKDFPAEKVRKWMAGRQ